MSSRQLTPLLGLVLAGACQFALAATATVYYYTPYKNWSSVYIHHNGSGTWTTVPGVKMDAACTDWVSQTVDIGAATSFQAVFNNGSGAWDNFNNQSGSNYVLTAGIHQVRSGAIQANAGSPCGPDVTPPTTPTLSTSNLTSTSVKLTWTASTDASGIRGYGLVRNGTLLKSTTGTTYTDSTLTAGTKYTYKVIAEDNAGNRSTYSASVSVTPPQPDTTPPTTPSNLTKGAVSSNSVSLSWTASTDAGGVKGYGIVRDGVLVGSTAGTSYTDTKNLLPSTTYAYKVIAEDKSGNRSSYSAVLSVTTDAPDTTPPTTPGTLSAALNGSSVNLTWGAATDNKGIAGYVITRTGGAGTATFNTTGTGTTYTDTSGVGGTTYSWSVKAKDTSGNLSAVASNAVSKTIPQTTPAFSWDNATVYFVLNDRFLNADTSNDRSYGRERTQAGVAFSNTLTDYPGTFHGGDIKGITQKVNDGYFTNLGINAIWITAPYEQIHGFVDGGGFKHYAYHGYYALDYTAMDQNMGTKADLIALVDAAHAKGIRIVMDIVMNHPGYDTLKDMNEFGFGGLKSGWENTAYRTSNNVSYDADIKPFFDSNNAAAWTSWWGADWLRAGIAGYPACNGTDGLTGCVAFLPDFRTDNASTVNLPPLLVTKWTRENRLSTEQASLDAWFTRTGRARTVPNYIIKWLTDWVRDTGIDGFRADTIKHVELSNWKALKEEAVRARNDWIAANPAKAALLTGDTAFWMTGEHWNHGIERDSYFDNGFDSLINFNFQGAAGNVAGLDATYTALAGVNANNSIVYNVLSYISSHDKGLFDRNNLKTGLTSLLLAPGGVQLFYGDETARPFMSNWGGDHAARSSMNWNSINTGVQSHAQKLGTFRNRHVAVGAGTHTKLADGPYTFSRVKGNDKVVIAIGANGTVAINVAGVFADGTVLRDAYTGLQSTVASGKANVAAHANGVVLLEQVQ